MISQCRQYFEVFASEYHQYMKKIEEERPQGNLTENSDSTDFQNTRGKILEMTHGETP
jgi:hypothetical protein